VSHRLCQTWNQGVVVLWFLEIVSLFISQLARKAGHLSIVVVDLRPRDSHEPACARPRMSSNKSKSHSKEKKMREDDFNSLLECAESLSAEQVDSMSDRQREVMLEKLTGTDYAGRAYCKHCLTAVLVDSGEVTDSEMQEARSVVRKRKEKKFRKQHGGFAGY
jgi:hypothetical protein